jgi:hypothetical protein
MKLNPSQRSTWQNDRCAATCFTIVERKLMTLSKSWPLRNLGVLALIALATVYAVGAEPPSEPLAPEQSAGKANEGEAEVPQAKVNSPGIESARKQARLMHGIYSATLDVMHHHYFHENKAILPARAMEDIFAELAEESKIKANWISVNTAAMSVHHEPKTDFEIKAAVELRTGKDAYEAVEKGYYYRAAPIALGAGCVSCHTGFFSPPGKTPRMAGLVIGIPVSEE